VVMGAKIFIVIPAYNEEVMIKKVISDLKKAKYRNIVVVDDGSSDKTCEVAKKQRVFALRHFINRGQGAALQTGIDFALMKGADVVVTYDADGQHQTKDIKKLVDPIVRGKAEVTLGSRFLQTGSNVPFLRRIYLKLGVVALYVMYGIKLSDSHNGFRAFSRKAAMKIRIKADRMEHASEIPELIKKNKIRYLEVPVDIRYTDYSIKRGQKNSDAFKIFFNMVMKKLMR